MDFTTTRRSLLAGVLTLPAVLEGANRQQIKETSHAGSEQVIINDDSAAVTISNGQLTIRCDKQTGLATYGWGGEDKVKGVYSAAVVESLLKTTDLAQHAVQRPPVRVNDAIGQAVRVTVVHRNTTGPEILQHYTVYDGRRFFLLQIEIRTPHTISTNYIGAAVADSPACVNIGPGGDNRVLRVPFDNDMWFRYNALPIDSAIDAQAGNANVSCEVTAVYDNDGRNGIVAGSVTHDIWKSGVRFSGASGCLNHFQLFAGNATEGVKSFTHDTLPHGKVSGTSVKSPVMFIGFYSDWRDGLEEYGHVNSIFHPPLEWKEGVPFGWNSWAAYAGLIDYSKFLGCAEFIATKLAPAGFEKNRVVYLNLDAFWSRLDAAQLRDAVHYCKALGKRNGVEVRPGIYYTPFAQWGNDFDRYVEGTELRYRYRDILLRAPDGSELPRIAEGVPLDPTHPGTKARIRANIATFRDLGFQYVKLDFLSHGTLEGAHWDKSVTTGLQAYNQGMKFVVEEAAGNLFISLSIAPLFPGGYGHARRISCDTMGHISGGNETTEYMLNSLSYAWWTNRSVYIADADEIPLGTKANQGARNEHEARSRYLSAIISGGMVLDSSAFPDDEVARGLAEKIYTNQRVNALAGGKAFRPVEGNTGDQATDVFVREESECSYVAVFNFNHDRSAEKRILLDRVSRRFTQGAMATDMWTGKEMGRVTAEIKVPLQPAESKLLKLIV
jgi:alpha-galactosidase